MTQEQQDRLLYEIIKGKSVEQDDGQSSEGALTNERLSAQRDNLLNRLVEAQKRNDKLTQALQGLADALKGLLAKVEDWLPYEELLEHPQVKQARAALEAAKPWLKEESK